MLIGPLCRTLLIDNVTAIRAGVQQLVNDLLPGCAGDVSDLLELYEKKRAATELAESTFNSRHLQYANFKAKLIAGRISPRTMRSVWRKLEAVKC